MMPPVAGVMVFAAAGFTHRERGHSSSLAIIGQSLNNGVAWAAIGTVRKRITIAPFLGVHNFLEALIAGGDIRRDKNKGLFLSGRNNGKFLTTIWLVGKKVDSFDEGKRRLLLFQGLKKSKNALRMWTFEMDFDSGAGVSHPAAQPEPASKPVDKGTEANSLDHTVDDNLDGINWGI